MNNIIFSIIICTYNGGDKIKDCLDSLNNLDFSKDNFEVIIINDGSTDNTAEIVKDYDFKLINLEKNEGLGYGRSTGINEAKGKYICFTDDDCILNKDYLTNLLKHYRENPGADGIGGKILPWKNDSVFEKYSSYSIQPIYQHSRIPKKRHIIIRFLSNFFTFSKPELKNGQQIYSVMGASSSYKSSLLKKIGGTDSSLKRGVDWEMNMRIWKKLKPKFYYFEDVFLTHKHRVGLKQFYKHVFAYGKALPPVYKKLNKKVIIHPSLLIALLSIFSLIIWPGYWYLYLLILPLLYYIKSIFYYLKLALNKKKVAILLFPIFDMLKDIVWSYGVIYGILKK